MKKFESLGRAAPYAFVIGNKFLAHYYVKIYKVAR